MRRLEEWAVVSYDRRGYQGSRRAGVAAHFETHVDDLLAVAAAYRGVGPVTAVGHSVGGTVVLAAAARTPGLFASIGVYEPSMPWLGFHPDESATPDGLDPQAAAEWFFGRLVGAAAWERMGEEARQDRRADGPALVGDLAGIREGVLFDAADVRVPLVVATGGEASFPHHIRTADWLAEHVPGAQRVVVGDAAHGAHLSHPDAFARVVRDTVALGATVTPLDT
jgi:pimeloyl-ACP methyl ester carboxylesterase